MKSVLTHYISNSDPLFSASFSSCLLDLMSTFFPSEDLFLFTTKRGMLFRDQDVDFLISHLVFLFRMS